MGGDTQPRPKPRPITSPDRPGLPDFSRETLKNMGRPGYEAILIKVLLRRSGSFY